MDRKNVLKEIEQIAAGLGIKLKYDELEGGDVKPCGGLCKVKGRYHIILDKRLKDADRIERLSEALCGFDLGGVAMSEEVRKIFESLKKNQA